MKMKIDGFEYIVKQKVIGLICEDENNYSIILKPQTKVSSAFKRQLKK